MCLAMHRVHGSRNRSIGDIVHSGHGRCSGDIFSVIIPT